MFGAWKPSAAKIYDRIMREALRPLAFRKSCRALFVVNVSTLKDPNAFLKLIRDQGLRWPGIQCVLDADRRSRSGREGMSCVAGDGRNHCGGEVASSHALRRTNATINVIEEYQEKSSDGANALRCLGLLDLLAAILGSMLSEHRRYPVDVQYLRQFGPAPGSRISLFHGRNVLLRRKQ